MPSRVRRGNGYLIHVVANVESILANLVDLEAARPLTIVAQSDANAPRVVRDLSNPPSRKRT